MYCIVCGDEIDKENVIKVHYSNGRQHPFQSRVSVCSNNQCSGIYKNNLIKSEPSKHNNVVMDGFCKECGEPLKINFASSKRMYKHRDCFKTKTKKKYTPTGTVHKYMNIISLKTHTTKYNTFYKHLIMKCTICGTVVESRCYNNDKERLCSNSRLKEMGLYEFMKHMHAKHRLHEENEASYKIKPWEDPESLFCDTAFLSNLCEKEISTGDECRGK